MAISQLTQSIDPAPLLLVRNLYDFKGSPAEFWKEFCGVLATLTGTKAFGLYLKSDKKDPSREKPWRAIHQGPLPDKDWLSVSLISYVLQESEAHYKNPLLASELFTAQNAQQIMVAKEFPLGSTHECCICIFHYSILQSPNTQRLAEILNTIYDLPLRYNSRTEIGSADAKLPELLNVLDISLCLDKNDKFIASAMSLCNEIAERFECQRVSFGILKGGYIKLTALSHMHQFDRKKEASHQLELAMEEAYEQDCDLLYPDISNDGFIRRDHQKYAIAQQIPYLATLLLRTSDGVFAVLCLERVTSSFSETDLRIFRTIADQSSQRLKHLHENDRWLGSLLLFKTSKFIKKSMGVENSFIKILTLVLTLLFILSATIPLPFKIEAPLILKTRDIHFITTPFNSHISQVRVEIGDKVHQGDTLLVLDQQELILQETGLIAEYDRYQREVEKALATESLAEMRVNTALMEQTESKLEVVRYQLSQSVLLAPYDGIVVEGDLKQKIGAPLKEAELLFKLAKINDIYVELKINENDIDYVKNINTAEIALTTNPQQAFDAKLTKIHPMALADKDANTFIAEASIVKSFIPDWWRPGMTGVAKVNAGNRSLLWMSTRKIIDKIYLWIWW